MNVIEALRPVNCVFMIIVLSVNWPFLKSKHFSFEWIIACYPLLLLAFRLILLFYTCSRENTIEEFNTMGNLYMNINFIMILGVRVPDITNTIETPLKYRNEELLMSNFLNIDNILFHRFNVDLDSNNLRWSTVKLLKLNLV